MDYFAISFSIFFVVMGFLVKRFPILIAGYNTMSAKKKKNVEIDKLSSLLCKGLVIGGVVSFIFYYLFKFLDMPIVAMIANMCLPLVIVAIANILAQKYDHNPKTKFEQMILSIIICIVIIVPLFIVGLIICGNEPIQISLENDKVVLSGIYGTSIHYSDIDTIERVESLPHIEIKTNGYALGGVLKGHFRLEKYGACRLFIHGIHPPFIVLTPKEGKKIIFNAPKEDADDLLKTYQTLQKTLTH